MSTHRRLIIPAPRDVRWQAGQFLISQQMTLTVSSSVDQESRTWMVETWRKFTQDSIPLEVVLVESDEMWWHLSAGAGSSRAVLQSDDAYSVMVVIEGASGAARDGTSHHQSWVTLLQLIGLCNLESICLPHVEIHDRPAIPMRALHMCVFPESRQNLLEKAIVLAGLMKYTHVVVEFWGTLQRSSLPELGWPEALSQRAAGQLFDLIRQYGMEVIPTFNIWGHASQSRIARGRHVILDQNPSLGPLFEPDGWTWCLSNPRTRSLLSAVVEETCAYAGPGRYFHLGCDEAHSHATCDTCRSADGIQLLVSHINDMTAHLRTLGRRAIMWGDAMLDRNDWPSHINATSVGPPTHQALKYLDRSILIADWQYEVCDGEIPTVAYFRERGFDVIVCPWFKRGNILASTRTARESGSSGMMLTTWDRLEEDLPMIATAAQAAWSADPGVPGHQAEFHLCQQRGHIARLLRFVTPSRGNYARSGWQSSEL